MKHEIKRGLDLPILGEPVQKIVPGPKITKVALVADDYIGMRPTMLVQEGDKVLKGEPLFSDKKTEGVLYVSPASGKVLEVNRGAKRKFESIVVGVDADSTKEKTFKSYSDLDALKVDQVKELLLESGQWSALRTRPYSKVPMPSTRPSSIFVTAIDTHPLAADPALVIAEHKEFFLQGLNVVNTLTEGRTFLCTAPDSGIPGAEVERVLQSEFEGPHPAGLVGTHIHLLDPVGPNKTVWYINYQDVIAIGHLFSTGKIMSGRTVSVAGPRVKDAMLYQTTLGASLSDLTDGKLIQGGDDSNNRIVSGSVFGGRTAVAPFDYLGRYHLQVSVLEEGDKKEFLGWQKPGFDKFSLTRVFASSIFGRGKKYAFNTNINGSHRAMVPIGTYEKIMPLDIMPTHLLRALVSRDTENGQALGCLELDEEDLALCSYVCPGKYDFGSILRDNLTQIEKEG